MRTSSASKRGAQVGHLPALPWLGGQRYHTLLGVTRYLLYLERGAGVLAAEPRIRVGCGAESSTLHDKLAAGMSGCWV